MARQKSILAELARYHATSYNFLQTKGTEAFLAENPEFGLEGWMNETTEKGRQESELMFEPLVPVWTF